MISEPEQLHAEANDLLARKMRDKQRARYQQQREYFKRSGNLSEIVIQHSDFMENWKRHPELRRWRHRNCQTADVIDMVTGIGADDLDFAVSIDRQRSCYPFLDLGFGAPVVSAWFLDPSDPLWEGHTWFVPEDPNAQMVALAYPEIIRQARQMPAPALPDGPGLSGPPPPPKTSPFPKPSVLKI